MESEVQQVLSVCPHADVDVIERDLRLTENVGETVNRILDGIIKPSSETKNNDSDSVGSEPPQRTLTSGAYLTSGSEEDDDPLPGISLWPGKTVMSSTVRGELKDEQLGRGKVEDEVVFDLTSEKKDGEDSRGEHHHDIFVKHLHHDRIDDIGSSSSVTEHEKSCDINENSNHNREAIVPTTDGQVDQKDKKNLLPLTAADTEMLDLTQEDSSPSKLLKSGHSIDISSSDDSEEEGGRVSYKHCIVSGTQEKHGRFGPQFPRTSNFGNNSSKETKSNFVKTVSHNSYQSVQNFQSDKQSPKGKMIDVSSSDDSDDELPLWKRIQKKNEKENLATSLKLSDVDNGINGFLNSLNNRNNGAVKGMVSNTCTESAMLEEGSQFSGASSVSVSHQITNSESCGLSEDGSLPGDSSESQLSHLSKGPKRKKRSPEEIQLSKQQALERRAERERQRQVRDQKKEEKRKEKERELEQRKALREAHRALRPEECMKRMTISVDQSLVEGNCGPPILKRLQELTCKVAITQHQVEGTITWSRQQTELNLGEDIQLSNLDKGIEESDALLVMKMNEFVHLIHATTQDRLGGVASGETLNAHAHRCIQTLRGKSVTYLVQGTEQYFRNSKNRHQRNFRSAVLGAEENQSKGKKGKRRKDDDDLPVISRVQMEEALVSLQLQYGCNVHCRETPDDIADFICMFTKAVAEKPFKKERDKATFSFHVNSEWAGGVRITKDGVGMVKVWKQQLQQFRNVSPEIAAAIIAKYPSPQRLLQGYRNCDSTREAEMLLQDIVIRRGEGVLATTRRVGPELSRRVYKQMTSVDGDQLL